LAASFVVPGPAGVAIRDRLRVSETDAAVSREIGVFLGSPASGDLAERPRQGVAHDAISWAVGKRELTGKSSAGWAGSITKATHDQWALARRGQTAHRVWLRGQIAWTPRPEGPWDRFDRTDGTRPVNIWAHPLAMPAPWPTLCR
jgi:hypothetical protein